MPAEEVCYWCGATPTSREHVPPKGLFPKNKRKDLKTVPSCDEHNHAFKKLDERMRFYIQGGCQTPSAFAEFNDTTIRGLKNPEQRALANSLINSLKLLPDGNAVVSMEYREHYIYYEKIARGLHYLVHKFPFFGVCKSFYRQGLGMQIEMAKAFRLFTPVFDRSIMSMIGPCADRSIFDYRYIDITGNNEKMFAVRMRFYEDQETISVLMPRPDMKITFEELPTLNE